MYIAPRIHEAFDPNPVAAYLNGRFAGALETTGE